MNSSSNDAANGKDDNKDVDHGTKNDGPGVKRKRMSIMEYMKRKKVEDTTMSETEPHKLEDRRGMVTVYPMLIFLAKNI